MLHPFYIRHLHPSLVVSRPPMHRTILKLLLNVPSPAVPTCSQSIRFLALSTPKSHPVSSPSSPPSDNPANGKNITHLPAFTSNCRLVGSNFPLGKMLDHCVGALIFFSLDQVIFRLVSITSSPTLSGTFSLACSLFEHGPRKTNPTIIRQKLALSKVRSQRFNLLEEVQARD